MAIVMQLRRGTTAEANAFTGAEGELFIDVDNKLLYLHDGTTQGGYLINDDDTTNTITSGSLSGNTITFTREDATQFTVDVSSLYDDTNLVTSVAGRTGAVTLIESDISGLQTTLDNKLDIAGTAANADLLHEHEFTYFAPQASTYSKTEVDDIIVTTGKSIAMAIVFG